MIPDTSGAFYAMVGLVCATTITAITTLLVALINRRTVNAVQNTVENTQSEATAGREQAERNETVAREVAQKVLAQLDTGNGHTIGQSASKVEDRLGELHNRVDALEVKQTEMALLVTESRNAAVEATVGLHAHLDDAEELRAEFYRTKQEWDEAKGHLQTGDTDGRG